MPPSVADPGFQKRGGPLFFFLLFQQEGGGDNLPKNNNKQTIGVFSTVQEFIKTYP